MTICLNMIVKNESKNMPRCLESVKDVVNYYVIDDTGSSDNTAEIIKEIMDGYDIEGQIYHTPWQNFGYNREQALRHADGKADYCLVMDADSTLHYEVGAFDKLTADSYMVEWRGGGISYKLPVLFSLKRAWHWKGVVHNYLVGDGKTQETLEGVWIEFIPSGGAKSHGRTSQAKFLEDARLLEEDLKKNPNDARSRFYLAQSYSGAGKADLAYTNYIRRINMKGWAEEVYQSMYMAAMSKWKRDNVFPLDDFIAAYNYRPTRAEPLFQISKYYRAINMKAAAYIFAKVGASLSQPDDRLFVSSPVYDWMMLDELAISAYWVGHYQESLEVCDQLLKKDLPMREVERIKKNRGYAERKLANK